MKRYRNNGVTGKFIADLMLQILSYVAQLTEVMESGWKLDLVINNQSDQNISIGITELKTNDVLADGCEIYGLFNSFGLPYLQAMLQYGFSIAEVAAGDTQTAEDVTYALEEYYLEQMSNSPKTGRH